MTLKKYVQLSELATTDTHKGLLPVSPATCWRWVRQGRLPKPFKIGPMTTVWDVEEVAAHLEAAKTGGQK